MKTLSRVTLQRSRSTAATLFKGKGLKVKVAVLRRRPKVKSRDCPKTGVKSRGNFKLLLKYGSKVDCLSNMAKKKSKIGVNYRYLPGVIDSKVEALKIQGSIVDISNILQRSKVEVL